MQAFADMMRKTVTMPAHFMDDGVHARRAGGHSLFDDFAAAAHVTGVYTASDYIAIMEHLTKRWDIAGRKGEQPCPRTPF